MPIHTAIKPQITENSVWNTAGEKPCVSHRKSRWTPAALSLLKQWDREKRDTEFSNMERKEWLAANSTTGKPVFQESKWGEEAFSSETKLREPVTYPSFSYFHVHGCSVCIHVHVPCAHLVSSEARTECGTPGIEVTDSYEGLDIESVSSARAATACKHRATSPAPNLFTCKECLR